MATTIRENRGWLKPHQPQFMNSGTLFNSRLKMIVRPISLSVPRENVLITSYVDIYIYTYIHTRAHSSPFGCDINTVV